MKGHLYKVSIERIEDIKGNAVSESALIFHTKNHDDIKKIVEKMQSKSIFDSSDTTSLAVGVKLLGEVMLKNKDHELFKAFFPHFKTFMQNIKKF